jgi:hypothetical protein
MWVHNQRHGEAMRDCPGIDEPIKKLESSLSRSEIESRRMVNPTGGLFRNKRGGKLEDPGASVVVSLGRGRLQRLLAV